METAHLQNCVFSTVEEYWQSLGHVSNGNTYSQSLLSCFHTEGFKHPINKSDFKEMKNSWLNMNHFKFIRICKKKKWLCMIEEYWQEIQIRLLTSQDHCKKQNLTHTALKKLMSE